MVNSRESLAKIPSMNNDANPYIVTLDIYKEGYWAYDISNYYKGRVDDNGTPFMVRWFEHGQLKNVQGLRPFIRGTVGQHTIDDQTDPDNPKVVPSPDCSQIDQTGETTDTAPGGIAIYRMVNACFTQEGMFYGEIGLKDSSGLVLSSVDIAFKVLGGSMNMLGARKFYVSEFEKALDNLNEIIENTKKDFSQELKQVIDDARNAYESETKNAHDSLDALKSQIKANRDEQENLAQHLAGTEQQIDTHDVVTRPEFQELSNQLNQQVSQMRQAGLEFYQNADELKEKYPDGANKLCVTLDDSHQWIYDYVNKQWNDAGAFNYGTLDPKLLAGLYSHNSDNLIPNSDFNTTNEWHFGEKDGTDPNVSVTADGAINGSNVLVLSNIKNGNANTGVWAQSATIPVGDRKNLSLGVFFNYRQNAGDNGSAFLQINWLDYQNNRTIWNSLVTPDNSDHFKKQIWENIAIPAGTKEFFIAFGLDGSGTLRILQPQVNAGITLCPYSGAEIALNLESTTKDLLANMPLTNWLIHNSGDSNISAINQYYLDSQLFELHSEHNTTDNYPFLRSPKISVMGNATLSLDLPYYADFTTGKTNAWVEIEQYAFQDGEADSRLNINRQINVQSDLKIINLSDLKLDAATKYITVTIGLSGAGTFTFGKPSLFYDYSIEQLNQKVKLLNDSGFTKTIYEWPINSWGGASNYTVGRDYDITYKSMPTFRLKNVSANCGVFAQSELIATNKADTVILDLPAYVHNDALAMVEVFQINQENVEKRTQYYLDKSDTVTNRRIVINLFDDTTAIRFNITANDLGDLNIAQPTVKLVNTEVKDLNPTLWAPRKNGLGLLPTKKMVDGTPQLLVDQNNNQSRDYWLFAESVPLAVKNNAISVKFTGSADIKDAKSGAFIEVDEFKSWADAVNGDPSGKQNLSFSGKTQEFNFENVPLDKDTKFITCKAVVQNNATIVLLSFQVHLSATIDDLLQISALPQMDIICNGSITDKWQKAQFKYLSKDKAINGYLQYAVQGSSSTSYPKKNFKVKLFKDIDCKDKLKVKMKSTWLAENKFNLKANWIDATQSRNLVNAHVFAKATAITPFANDGANLAKAPNVGQMDGFPFELYLNGQYYGLMTWNIKKTDKSFGMDDKKAGHEVIDCYHPMDKTLGDPTKTIDGKEYETNIQDTANDTLKNNFKNFLTFISTASDTDFKAKLGNYIDIKSVINAYLWGIFAMMQDYENKSMMICTWDNGKTYYLTLYDMDSTWNLWWRGNALNQEPNRWTFDLAHPANDFTVEQNVLYNRLWKLFKPELKAQWQYLRANVWRNDQIISAFKKFINRIPVEAYKRDQLRWPDIPSIKITDFEQIQQSVIERGTAMDNFMEHLTDSQPTSPAPQPTTPQAQPASGTTPTTPQAQPTEPKQ